MLVELITIVWAIAIVALVVALVGGLIWIGRGIDSFNDDSENHYRGHSDDHYDDLIDGGW